MESPVTNKSSPSGDKRGASTANVQSKHPPRGDNRGSLQTRIAVCSFIAAVAFSIAGFIVPPLGDLTEANLYLVAQFLLVTTSLFGVSAIVSRSIISKFNKNERENFTERVEE